MGSISLEMKSKNIIFPIFLVLLMLCGCTTDQECRQERNSPAMVSIYQVVFDNTTEQYLNETYSIPLRVYPIDFDSMLYNRSVSSLSLPLKRIVGETAFSLTDTLSNISDTLNFTYVVTDAFMSLQCGCVPNFYLEEITVTNHMIDSAVIANPEVNPQGLNNVNIYFRNTTTE